VLHISAVTGIDVLEVDGWHDLGVATGSAVSHYSQLEWARCAMAVMRAMNDALDLEFPREPSPAPGPPGAASAGASGLRTSSGTTVRSPSAPLVPGPGSAVSVAAEGPGASMPAAECATSVPMVVDSCDSVSACQFSLLCALTLWFTLGACGCAYGDEAGMLSLMLQLIWRRFY
jgi:hypothetical protein